MMRICGLYPASSFSLDVRNERQAALSVAGSRRFEAWPWYRPELATGGTTFSRDESTPAEEDPEFEDEDEDEDDDDLDDGEDEFDDDDEDDFDDDEFEDDEDDFDDDEDDDEDEDEEEDEGGEETLAR